jgi:SAM-dependent methyltransferase
VTDERYIFGEVEQDPELDRLRVHEAWLDPISERYLRRIGVTDGMRCLDVGAGGGSIARWLSDQVGPAGTVVAADLDPKFLTNLPANVEVRRVDVLADDLERDAFDVIHCRTVLGHVSEPKLALERMAHALAPGGVLLCVDDDLGLVSLAGDGNAPAATQLFHNWFGRLASLGIVNAFVGRAVPGLLAEIGLDGVSAEASTMISRKGDTVHEDHRRAYASVRPLVEANGIDGAAWDAAVALFDLDSVIYVGTTVFMTWGRKPR